MREIEINTGLDGFILLDAITSVDPTEIRAIRTFENAHAYLGIETLAQAGAFHLRWLTGFERHIFLLKVGACNIPSDPLNGEMRIAGKLLSRSDSAFRCMLRGECGDAAVIQGDFFFGAADYDTRFNKELIRSHYEKTMACLLKDTNQS